LLLAMLFLQLLIQQLLQDQWQLLQLRQELSWLLKPMQPALQMNQ